MANGYEGEEKRKNGITITFDLKEYLEKEYLEKIKAALPCKVHEERMKGIQGKITWLWVLVSGLVLGIAGIFLRTLK